MEEVASNKDTVLSKLKIRNNAKRELYTKAETLRKKEKGIDLDLRLDLKKNKTWKPMEKY